MIILKNALLIITKTEKLRTKLKKELNELDNTNKNKTFFWTIFSTGIIVKILIIKREIIKV